MAGAVRKHIDKAPQGTWFHLSTLGRSNNVEQQFSRLSRDPQGPVIRAAKGLYYKSGPADPFFGKLRPSPVEIALEVARGQGVGPAGTTAVAFLGFTTQVPPRPSLAIVGSAPTGITGVDWQVRRNVARTKLTFAEIAVVELLSIFPVGSEVPWNSIVNRISQLRQSKKVRLDRIQKVVAVERRKPKLQKNFNNLLIDLKI